MCRNFVKNQNKACNVTLVTYPGVLEFDPQMRLSCDRVSMTLELSCLFQTETTKKSWPSKFTLGAVKQQAAS